MPSREDCSSASCAVAGGFFFSSSPSLAGSVFFLAAFSLLIPATLFAAIRHKTPFHSSSIITGLAMEIMAYVGRTLLRSDISSTSYILLYVMGVDVGPVFITTGVFLVLPHMVVLYGKELSLVSQPIHFTVFFLAFGTFTLAFQAVGVAFSMTGGTVQEMTQGRDILVAGHAMQVLSILLFYFVSSYLTYRLYYHRQSLSPRFAAVYGSTRFSLFLLCIHLAVALLLARTIIRIVALAGGLNRRLDQSETPSLVLDGALVLLACLLVSAVPVGAAFGSAWAETSPFSSRIGDEEFPSLRYARSDHRYQRADALDTPPLTPPSAFWNGPPPYAPTSPALSPDTTYNLPPYTTSPKKVPYLPPYVCPAPNTPPDMPERSLVRPMNLW